MSLGCSATNCASSCRRSCVGAEERSAWSSVGSCRLGCTNAQSSQTGRLLRCSNSDWDGQRTKRNLRTKVSKPPKPTILDLSHRPHHRRLPRQRFSATDVTEYFARLAGSLRLDVGRSDHLGPLFDLVGNEFSEFGGCQ